MADASESSDEMDATKAMPPLLQKLKTKFSFKKSRSSKALKESGSSKALKESGDVPSTSSPRKKINSKQPYARIGNTHAAKKTRKVQIGLKVDGIHVRREDRGGGKRFAQMNKSDVKQDIIGRAKTFFFPDGMSKMGPLANFTFELEDFQGNPVGSSDTVGSLYDSTGLGLLRFYLCAISKDLSDKDEVDRESKCSASPPATVMSASPSQPEQDSNKSAANQTGSSMGIQTTGLSSLQRASPSLCPSLETNVGAGPSSDPSEDAAINASENTNPDVSVEVVNFTMDDVWNNPGTSAIIDYSFVEMGTPSVQVRRELLANDSLPEIVSPAEEGSSPSEIIVEDEINGELFDVALDPMHRVFDDYPDIVLEGSPLQAEANFATQVEKIRLHRGQVLRELIDYYKIHDTRNTVEVQMLLPNGTEEAAEDNGGVMRDALCEFWEEFFEMNSVGENIKVPCLRHNMKQADWQACARVLVVGFRQEGYFPVQLAPPFLQFALNGDDAVQEKSLLDTFMEFIPECEREVFSRAETDFQALDEDDLLDALEAHNVRVQVTSSNVQAVLKEVAHKEIIQAPAYVARCWHGIMQELKPLLTMSFDKMRERMSPNTERVLQMLQFPDEMKQGMPETAKMLRRYVKSLSKEKLRRFLRFLTGSDLLLRGKKITVRFVVQSYFTRRPIPHTCGCVLELAYDFNNFMDFRSEFNKVLESNVWVMDIV